MIILSMIETTSSEVVSIMIRLKMADGLSAQKNQNWGYYEADEEIQRQLSAMGRKQNIWESIAAKLNGKMQLSGNSIN